MSKGSARIQNTLLPPEDREALRHLRSALERGTFWPYALLQAMALWTSPEEVYRGHHYRYMIDGEAFDWVTLAERLCDEVNGLIPADEKEHLLFHGCFPQEMPADEFRRALGHAKHSGYLNFYYGIVVEEAVCLAVEEEVRKAYISKGFEPRSDYAADVYERLYHESRDVLLERFLSDKGHPTQTSLSYTQLREFTYWLFKRRIKTSDPAKVASDTCKGLRRLEQLHKHRTARSLAPPPTS